MTVKFCLKECKNRLNSIGVNDPLFEARCLVMKVLNLTSTKLISNCNDEVDSSKLDELYSMINRRANNEPLQYILGSWSFYGIELYVGEGVLIPRDDTEIVVNLCTDFLRNRKEKKVIDLCAGSGAISLAIEKISDADVTAVELSNKAFEYLTKNIQYNKSSVNPINDDIFTCHTDFEDGSFDLIVSNPPYIKSDDLKTLQAEVQKEPSMALDGGKDGFDFYKAIVSLWSKKLKKGGALAFELGEKQAEYVTELMKAVGFGNIHTEIDFGGVQRAIIGTLL